MAVCTTEGSILFRMHDSFESRVWRPDNISLMQNFILFVSQPHLYEPSRKAEQKALASGCPLLGLTLPGQRGQFWVFTVGHQHGLKGVQWGTTVNSVCILWGPFVSFQQTTVRNSFVDILIFLSSPSAGKECSSPFSAHDSSWNPQADPCSINDLNVCISRLAFGERLGGF